MAALAIIKEWNLDSELLYAMVGCNTEEINALKTLYPGKYWRNIISLAMREKCPYSELFWPVFSCIRTK